MVSLFPVGHPWRVRLVRLAAALRPHKTLLAVAAGLTLQWAAVQYTVSRPLHREVQRLTGEVGRTGAQMQQLAALRGAARQSQDLLAALEAQRSSLSSAEQALADIRQLRMNLEQEARRTAAASNALVRLSELQQRLTQSGEQTARLTAVLEQLAAIHARIEGLARPAEQSLAAATQADGALTQLTDLQSRLLAQSATLPAAAETVEQSLQLQATLADAAATTASADAAARQLLDLAQGLNTVTPTAIEASTGHATDLLALHDLLADAQSLRLSEAEDNLRALLHTQSELLRSTPHVAAAAENLELLTGFQTELSRQLESLDGVRKDLLNVTLLRETVQAVTSAVSPLAELSNLRRLDPDQVRLVARELLDRRSAQTPQTSEVSSVGTVPASVFSPDLEAAVPSPIDP